MDNRALRYVTDGAMFSVDGRGLKLSGITGQRVGLGQASGPDVELVVTGTELYANYETPDGYPAIYDDRLGLFCFARVVDGKYDSTGVSVEAKPPPGVQRYAKESDAVRTSKIAERQLQIEQRAQASAKRQKSPASKE
jgi:hypothetical protein